MDTGFFILKKAISEERIKEVLSQFKALGSSNKNLEVKEYNLIGSTQAEISLDTNIFYDLFKNKTLSKILNNFLTPNFFIAPYDDIILKKKNGKDIFPHQDLLDYDKNYQFLNIGIYLNSSENNPVYFLPYSHKYGVLTKDSLNAIVHNKKEQFEPVIAEAGDIIIHNPLTIHYSLPNADYDRYTWYFEAITLSENIKSYFSDKDLENGLVKKSILMGNCIGEANLSFNKTTLHFI